MKKVFKSMIAILAVGSLLLGSCSKYEDGPGFTVRTAKARISGDWKLTSYTLNGTDYTSSLPTITMTIEKDGSFTSTYTSGSFSTTETGTWVFNDDKTTVAFTASSNTDTYTITELKSKEMKLQQVNGSNTEVSTYTAQ